MVSPIAGLAIAACSSVVIRGGKNPCVVDFNSRFEEGSGVKVPIPICALVALTKKKEIRSKWLFFMLIFF